MRDSLLTNTPALLQGKEAWPGSYIAVNEAMESGIGAGVSLFDNISNLIMVIIILSLFTVTFMRIAEGLISSVISTFNMKRLIAIEQQTHLQNSRNITLTFLLIVSAFIFANYNGSYHLLENHLPSGMNFIISLAAAVLYFTFRYIMSATLNWVNGVSFFRILNRFYYTYCIIFITLSISGFLLCIIIDSITFRHVAIYILASVLITNFLYYIRCWQIIISNGFSHFFLILYLCTLEILPQLVLAHLILS